MKNKLVIHLVTLITASQICLAQMDRNQIKEYLHTTRFPIDTEASAVILSERMDIEVTSGEEVNKEIITIHETIKILKTEGLHLADVRMNFPIDNDILDIYGVSGTTYSLDENDKVTETDLATDDFYKTKLTKDYNRLSFAMPEVKVGSIIDYTYKLAIPRYLMLPTWEIQGDQPKLMTEYSVKHEEVRSYNCIIHSRCKLTECKKEEDMYSDEHEFCHYYNNNNNFKNGKRYATWVRKNVPAMKDEPFVVNKKNHLEMMEMQTVRNKLSIVDEKVYDTWDKYNEDRWKSDFEKNVRKPNNFLNDTIKKIVGHEKDSLQIARKIYRYVKENFKTNNKIKTSKNEWESIINKSDIEAVFNKKEGTGQQINGLLVAMLNNAGLEAYTLYTGNTNTLSAVPQYPVLTRLSYSACALRIGGKYTFLDASDKYMPFGILPATCYNGYARIISEKGDSVYLKQDMLFNKDSLIAAISFVNDSTIHVTMTVAMGTLSTFKLRHKLENDTFNMDNFFEKYLENKFDGAELTEKKIINLDKADTNLVLILTFNLKKDKLANTYLLNTSFIKHISKNPFSAITRNLPIEYSYKSEDEYTIRFEIPEYYKIDSIPPATDFKVGDNGLAYHKSIVKDSHSNNLTVTTIIKNNTVVYPRSKYSDIRNFYENVIKDQNSILELKRTN